MYEICGNKIHIFQVTNEKEVEEKISKFQERYQGRYWWWCCCRYGPKYGIIPIVIKTGREAIISAIEEAKELQLLSVRRIKEGKDLEL